MANFLQLKQRASRRLQDENNTAVSLQEVGDAINTAIRYWKQERFWFNEFGAIPTVTPGSPVLPLGLLYPLQSAGIRVLYQNTTFDLKPISNLEYDSAFIDQTGRPYAYTWRDGAYYLHYTPDIAYTVNVTGIRDYVDLVNDSDTNDFTDNADQLILYDALSRMTAELRTDPAISEYYTNRTQDEKRNLKRRTNKMIGTGRLSAGDDYYYYGRY